MGPSASNSLTSQTPTNPVTWPPDALATAEHLHRLLTIGDRQWHALKGQQSRRAAEQIAAALVVLLKGERPTERKSSPARQEAIALLTNAEQWLQGQLTDQGCPRRSS